MSSIRGGGPKGPGEIDRPQQSRPDQQVRGDDKGPQTHEQRVVDRFVGTPDLSRGIEGLAGKKILGPIQFTNQHLAQVAMQFASMLRTNPNADRRARARMFAKAFLKNKKFGRIFDQADENDLENLYDQLAEQLDASPVFAQLVDEITEGARKINLG